MQDKSEPDHPIATLLARVGENWPEAATPEMALSLLVQRLARLLQELATDCLAPFGLSVTEFEVLAALRTHPAPHRLTPSRLYEATLLSSGGLTKVLKGLEAEGLVGRPAADGDGRSRPVELTEAGRERVEAAMAAVQAAEAPLLVGAMAAPADADRLQSLLGRALAVAEARRRG
ncbi:MarR family winged helix-turn-helix transcriptional regulator [Acuticoccus kandeliae]|uniref:MarR family winged helix-turn-helix transcriptional regulator n=1 Tax=Acuticoccus kandeliae TaxID=2073160 RepID=UPI0013002EB7|nr:MarR family transcriptional regulator [Acuticoccus kandeliae]